MTKNNHQFFFFFDFKAVLNKYYMTQILSLASKRTPVYFNWNFPISWSAIINFKILRQLDRGEKDIIKDITEIQLTRPIEIDACMGKDGKGKVCYEPRRPIRPALISGFCSMKRLGVFPLPPGWDASPSQGHPQH